jgi:acyl-CoA hydrolase
VRIELWAHRRREQRDLLAATGTITYVQVDENKKPIPFPQQD